MWFFGRRKVKAPPDEIADSFLSEFVENDNLAPSIELDLTPEQQQCYRSKCKIYRLALVLMALMNDEHENPAVLQVRQSIETKVFHLPDEHSCPLLQHVQSAMTDLQALLGPNDNRRELSWARAWFEAIGVDATNPADLVLFSCSWMDDYVAATKSLREFRIL